MIRQTIKDVAGFTSEGTFYKGNLHSHTTNSDGNFTPEQAVEEFSKRGYSFLCMSDHDLYTDYSKELGKEDFIVLPGLEMCLALVEEDGNWLKVHHMNGILGTKEMQEKAIKAPFSHKEKVGPFIYKENWDGAKEAEQKIKELHDRGMFVTYNHPIWSRVKPQEILPIQGIDILEIFNYNTQNESMTGYDIVYWDQMLRSKAKVFADASDDNHNAGVFDDAFGGYIMVKAKELTHDAIVSSILSGSYYSSSGPRIFDWGIKDKKVFIKCSDVERITFVADGYIGAGRTQLAPEDGVINFAEYPLTGRENYVRVECRDKFGKTAWTNPIFFE